MVRIRRAWRAARTRTARGVIWPFRRLWAWWTALEPAERVLYRAVAFLAAGCALVYPPAGLIVPGALFALAFFDFSFRRRA